MCIICVNSILSIEVLPKHLLELKLKQKSFIDELMNLKNVREINLPIKIKAELRSYQIDGIKWLSFLNRYKLHGILCDDMGLGKSICVDTSQYGSTRYTLDMLKITALYSTP